MWTFPGRVEGGRGRCVSSVVVPVPGGGRRHSLFGLGVCKCPASQKKRSVKRDGTPVKGRLNVSVGGPVSRVCLFSGFSIGERVRTHVLPFSLLSLPCSVTSVPKQR